MITDERTEAGLEIETALGEVLAHVRGETALPCRIVDDPAPERIVALRKRMKLSRQKFADRFGLDTRAIQDWEQGRRVPDRAALESQTVRGPDFESGRWMRLPLIQSHSSVAISEKRQPVSISRRTMSACCARKGRAPA